MLPRGDSSTASHPPVSHSLKATGVFRELSRTAGPKPSLEFVCSPVSTWYLFPPCFLKPLSPHDFQGSVFKHKSQSDAPLKAKKQATVHREHPWGSQEPAGSGTSHTRVRILTLLTA